MGVPTRPLNPDWLVPDWPAPDRVRAVCTTRSGGVSQAPFDTFNLGDHVGDAADAVHANRSALQAAMGVRPVFLRQVHGAAVVAIDQHTLSGAQADACVTRAAGVACTIMVADCLPVLLTDTLGRAVAAAHAGWRGLAGQGGLGVLEAAVRALRQAAGHDAAAGRAEILAWLGPCIGAQAFEVGAEVYAAFCAADPAAARHFRGGEAGKYRADLQGLARQRLAALGVSQIHGNDGSIDWCSVSQPARFFSHRREGLTQQSSGRMAACVWLHGDASSDVRSGPAQNPIICEN